MAQEMHEQEIKIPVLSCLDCGHLLDGKDLNTELMQFVCPKCRKPTPTRVVNLVDNIMKKNVTC